ncbi:MAG: hypothetical protein ACYC2O_02650 [Microthrixaceae bacterium]
MSSFRDRFLTPKVARAITSPSAIVLAGAGASAGILIGLGPIGAVLLAAGAFAGRVLAAVPRAPKRPGINPKELQEPWRGLVQEILDASRRFDRALQGVRPGPLRDRLGELGDRLTTGVDEAWRIASAGDQLAAGRRQIDTARVHAELQQARAMPHTERSEQTIAAIEAQLASAERLDATINDTHDRLRLLDARIDETVTRTVELSVTQSDTDAIGVLDDEVESIVDDMEALRQAVEESRSMGHLDAPTLPHAPPLPHTPAPDPAAPQDDPRSRGTGGTATSGGAA